MTERDSYYGLSPYNSPKKLLTAEEYREKANNFGKDKNLTVADKDFLDEVENLRNELYDLIVYDSSELEVTGTKYYVANGGNDEADGLSPETAWSSLEKVTNFKFQEGDGVYFKRGDLWRGNTVLQSGVTYQAYGIGTKPKIYYSFDGKTVGKWVKSEIENVWVLDTPLDTRDIGVIVFNGGKKYAEKKKQKSELQNELDFYFSGNWVYVQSEKHENKLYLYCSEGNPAEIFEEIELSRQGHVIQIENFHHDIKVHNLDVRYGQDYFLNDSAKNIELTYCIFAWMGGHYGGDASNYGCYRFGGGGGAWRACDNMKFEHCFFTQHFDCAMSPQFSCNPNQPNPNVYTITPYNFKGFHVNDCLIEYTEYSFEYFARSCKDRGVYGTPGYFDMYFGYNICRKTHQGFGDKHGASNFIRAGFSENNCYDSVFEKNLFDRSGALALQLSALEGDSRKNKISYDLLPKLKGNIYIDPKNKRFAQINKIYYDFNSYSKAALEKLGVEKDSVYIYTPEE